jgi:hypothetical protein
VPILDTQDPENQKYLRRRGSMLLNGVGPAAGASTPANGYVAEDGVTFYVAEDGTTFYVQES